MKQKPAQTQQAPVDPSYDYSDSAGSLTTTRDGGNTTDGSFSDAYTISDSISTATSDLSNIQEMNGGGSTSKISRTVDDSSDKDSDGDIISPVRVRIRNFHLKIK